MGGTRRHLFICVFLTLSAIQLSACSSGGGGGDDAGHDDQPSAWQPGVFLPSDEFANQCSSALWENNWLRSWSHETYLWYDEIEDRDPAGYADPTEYFALLKTEGYTPSGSKKDNFHYSMPTAEWNQQSESGVSVGYGFQWAVFNSNPEQVYAAYSDSEEWPAEVARGMRVVRIGDVYMSQVSSQADIDFINNALWPSAAGDTHEFEFERGDGTLYTVELTAANVVSDPVPKVDVLEGSGGERVGYLLFNDHIGTAEKALRDAVTQLRQQSIDELVLDLRYNGGGYLAIASQLAYMIAGPERTEGKTFELMQFNDQHPTHDPVTGEPLEPIPFIDVTLGEWELPGNQSLPSLNLERVFVLAGPNTCSASEAIINSLRGVNVKVVLIGSQTCGKPYGFYPTDNCGTTWFTIQFKGVNDKGFGEYSDGFAPSSYDDGYALVKGCEVADDFSHPLGDENEGRLAVALNYIAGGQCATSAAAGFVAQPQLGVMFSDGKVVKPAWRQNRIVTLGR
ncbi:S41 family peptidase [Microbulbifer thermotolerans]|uniref:S41 family peptidase n=1 Tax=Microbulbifer thermotolerans TaxID=252514 RepID=UPI00224B23D8|nr:S41 family peptidase [Microbulbifer thermotolerans]MCX2783960.1 S41 family peptidase [Microbulbifer thermotolerans]